MAFLLLLHEKMRLTRKVNKLTLKLAQDGHRLERVQNRIKQVQKMYTKKQTMLENTAKMLQSRYTNSVYSNYGLGMNNPMAGGMGMSPFVLGNAKDLFKTVKDNGGSGQEWTDAHFDACMKAIQGGYPKYTKDAEGNQIVDYGEDINGLNLTSDEDKQNLIKDFRMCMQQAQYNQSNAQYMCKNQVSQYESNISIWLDAAKTQMEDEQTAALAPLEAEETMWQLEQETDQTQLTWLQEYKKNIEQALKEQIQDSVPKFGLG